MRKLAWSGSALALALIVLATPALAGSSHHSHYVNGVEGIKAASLPPPGLYGRIYGVYYTADKMKDDSGNAMKVPTPDGQTLDMGFDLKVYAVVPRVIWVSPYEILGGNYFADAVLPFLKTDVSIDVASVDDSKFGIGDLCVEPFGIAWHGAQYDAAVAAGGYLPTGLHDLDNAASPGKDMWTAMFTAGGTLYADAERTWSASILSRYEIHSEKKDAEYTPGNDFHFEWGLGKTFNKTLDVGVAGYCYWQVTDDKDLLIAEDKSRVFAAGPEVSYFIPSQLMFLSARMLWEFEARNQQEGMIGVLTLTKGF